MVCSIEILKSVLLLIILSVWVRCSLKLDNNRSVSLNVLVISLTALLLFVHKVGPEPQWILQRLKGFLGSLSHKQTVQQISQTL